MKKIMTLMAMAVIFTACSNEETESPLDVYSLTGYADTESRTVFVTPNADKIPFAWSANDYIYAGSTKSNVITSEEAALHSPLLLPHRRPKFTITSPALPPSKLM